MAEWSKTSDFGSVLEIVQLTLLVLSTKPSRRYNENPLKCLTCCSFEASCTQCFSRLSASKDESH
ncbi:hypothetical protein J6590_076223 [Homalodisca vitripennis]|nr:hypothetical protein J6590_076223 [Homalodisca vitripennis]